MFMSVPLGNIENIYFEYHHLICCTVGVVDICLVYDIIGKTVTIDFQYGFLMKLL